MNGARKIAIDFVRPYLEMPRVRSVLDICCGDGWLRQHVIEAGKAWNGIDRVQRPLHGMRADDLTKPLPHSITGFEMVTSIYGTQHLLGHEAQAWLTARKCIANKGIFLVVARYRKLPGCEMGRQDPLNGHNHDSLEGLAMSTGFGIVNFNLWKYEGDHCEPSDSEGANAFCAELWPV